VSAGCDHCYIDRTPPFRMQGRRFDKPGGGGTTGVRLHPERLEIPLHWRKPRRIFVNSLSDLFHDDVPDGFIGSVFDVMARTPRHTYQLLTKRPGRARSLLNRWADPDRLVGSTRAAASFRRYDAMWSEPDRWPLPNVWLGVSAEDQRWADIRVPLLLQTPAAVRWVSAEPLLGPLDLSPYMSGSEHHGPWFSVEGGTLCSCRAPVDGNERCTAPGLDWVVAGGESGRDARPMRPEWAAGLRDQCAEAGVPYFFKQWGDVVWDADHLPDDTVRAVDNRWNLGSQVPWPLRVGKKAAGRLLDGRTHDDYPAAVA
jgi:protein gp37